jgi:hypothetical protein
MLRLNFEMTLSPPPPQCYTFSTCPARSVGLGGPPHRVQRVATAAFWRTFSDEGKISPGW